MGYTYALSFIGDIYRTGPEELIDYAEAKRYYQKGVDVNEINAIKGMAFIPFGTRRNTKQCYGSILFEESSR